MAELPTACTTDRIDTFVPLRSIPATRGYCYTTCQNYIALSHRLPLSKKGDGDEHGGVGGNVTIVMVSTCRGYDGVGVDGDAHGGVGAGGRTTRHMCMHNSWNCPSRLLPIPVSTTLT